jgi:hypothetical protein
MSRAHAALGTVVRLPVDGVGERPALSLGSGGPQQGKGDGDSFHGDLLFAESGSECCHALACSATL